MRTLRKTPILLLTICICVLPLRSLRAQIFDWATSTGDDNMDRGQGIAVDSEGNAYTTGFFSGSVDFDPGPDTTLFETALSGRNIFIAKYDPEGNLTWVKNIGNDGIDEGRDLSLDVDGNILITGRFSNLTDFDPGPEEFFLQGFSADVFVLKLNSDGEFIWAKKIGGNLNQLGRSITSDTEGNVFVTGSFREDCDFDPGPGETIISAIFNFDCFIVKLSPEGDFEWVQVMRSQGHNTLESVDIDSEGNVLVAGNYQSTLEFGIDDDQPSFTTEQLASTFVSKIDNADGSFIWVKEFQGNNSVTTLRVDSEDNVLTTGDFVYGVDFDPGEDTYELDSFHFLNRSVYVSKLDSNGDFVWAKRFGGVETCNSKGLSIDSEDNVLFAGGFTGNVDFDPSEDTVALSSIGAETFDRFVCKLNSDGEYKWVKPTGGASYDMTWAITLDEENNLYTTGSFQDTSNFATMDDEFHLVSNGYTDYFVSKWSACINSYSFQEFTVCDSLTWIDGNTYTESNYTATVVMQNATCCDSIITLNLTIPEIETGVVVTDESMYSYQPQAIYQWFECVDNELIPMEGEIEQTLYPDTAGYYAVSVENMSCVDTSECYYFGTVGLEEKLNEDAFSVFPNPTRGELTIEGNGQILEVRLTNLQGQLVMRDKTNHLDISSLAHGAYLISIRSENGIWRKRIVKE